MTIQEVMDQERAALLGESVIRDPIGGWTLLPYAAVTDPEILERTPTFIRAKHPIRIESLGDRDRGMAFVQICPSLKYKFLWVHAGNDRYRDDYKAFLRDFQSVTETLPGNLHADHLYNRERAKHLKTPFVRMVLLPAGVNVSQGAGYEKSRTNSPIGAEGRDHKMDEITLMKLCGIPSPRKGQPLTAAMTAHVHRVAQLHGLSVRDIEQGINNLMQVAAFKPHC